MSSSHHLFKQKFDVDNTLIDQISSYFSLYQSSSEGGNVSIESSLENDSNIIDVVNSWTIHQQSHQPSGEEHEVFKLVFMIRLFVPSIWGLQYYDVISRRLKTPNGTKLPFETYLHQSEVISPGLLHFQYIQVNLMSFHVLIHIFMYIGCL